MKIATWNVNSIRARIDNIKKYLKLSSPDILLLQEIKTEEINYPFKEFDALTLDDSINGDVIAAAVADFLINSLRFILIIFSFI